MTMTTLIAVNPMEIVEKAAELSKAACAVVDGKLADVFGTFSLVRRHLAAGFKIEIVGEVVVSGRSYQK